MKALITGATGFLGSALAQHLRANDHDVIPFKGDVRDEAAVRDAVAGQDVVFHLAAVVAVKPSQRPLLKSVNVEGTANIVAALRGRSVRLVHVSSVAAVGFSREPGEPLDETHRQTLSWSDFPNNASKRESETRVLEAASRGEIDGVVVNPSLIYGPGDARKAARQGNVQIAHGKFPFYFSGGVNVVGIDDVIAGLVAARERGRRGERYILAGENVTNRELFKWIAQEAGVPEASRALPASLLRILGTGADLLHLDSALNRETAAVATLYHWFSNEKARRELDFRPGSSRDAVARSVRWMKENMDSLLQPRVK